MSTTLVRVEINAADEIDPILPDDHGRGWVAINHSVELVPADSDEAARVGNAFTALAHSLAVREAGQS